MIRLTSDSSAGAMNILLLHERLDILYGLTGQMLEFLKQDWDQYLQSICWMHHQYCWVFSKWLLSVFIWRPIDKTVIFMTLMLFLICCQCFLFKINRESWKSIVVVFFFRDTQYVGQLVLITRIFCYILYFCLRAISYTNNICSYMTYFMFVSSRLMFFFLKLDGSLFISYFYFRNE